MDTKSFSEYRTWFLKQYRQLQEQLQDRHAYRLIDVIYDSSGDVTLEVQVTGKAAVLTLQADEVAANDAFMEGFSKKDIRMITYLATKKILKPKYSILGQEVNNKTNQVTFQIACSGEPQPIGKTASEITLDKDFLAQLSQADAHLVGYVCANEQTAYEKIAIKRLKIVAENVN